jgi:hypothetical protein
MAFQMIKSEWCPIANDYRRSFVLDSAADAKNLPKCCAGSTAIVAEKDGSAYLVDASGEWREV